MTNPSSPDAPPPSQAEQDADRAAASGQPAEAVRLLETAVSQTPARAEAWLKLSAMRRAGGDLSAALAAIDAALSHQPLDYVSLLSRAHLLDQMRRPDADEAFATALAQVPDKVSPALERPTDQARERAMRFQQATEVALTGAAGQIGGDEGARIERLISNFSHRTRHYHQAPSHFHYPGMPELEFHPVSSSPGLVAIEAATATIRTEFDQLLASEAAEMVPYIQYPERVPLNQWKALNHSRDWTAIHLLQNGRRIESNARHCPRTLEALAALDQPDIPGASPNAMFSLLAPHTRIPPHSGVANVRLVAHLPLIVPSGCGFRVGETRLAWQVGHCILFDDTIEHEAWNDSGELRVVMIVDLWAPALAPSARAAVSRVIASSGSLGGEGL